MKMFLVVVELQGDVPEKAAGQSLLQALTPGFVASGWQCGPENKISVRIAEHADIATAMDAIRDAESAEEASDA
jgi:hypothetical protein